MSETTREAHELVEQFLGVETENGAEDEYEGPTQEDLAWQAARDSEGERDAAPERFRIVALDEFAAVDEPGSEAILGDGEEAVIGEDFDVMIYGDGGAGKTTLAVDLACHLAAGDDWLGVEAKRPARVLVVENEGPRSLFRRKLRAKLAAWEGSPLEGRVSVLEEPWAEFTFAKEEHREALAGAIRDRELDVVIVGPLAASGMDEAGTLQDVRAFLELLRKVRRPAGRRVTFILVHHEAKGGKVSGAWEGGGDTLLHVQGEGHGRTRLHVQKARWASSRHQTTLHLVWTDGEGFAAVDAETREAKQAAKVADALEWIADYVEKRPGQARSVVEQTFHEAHGKGRNTARKAVDEQLEALARWREGGETPPRLATTTGETRHGIYLIPFSDAVSPLAEELFGESGEKVAGPEAGGGLAVSPPPRRAARRSGESTDGAPPPSLEPVSRETMTDAAREEPT